MSSLREDPKDALHRALLRKAMSELGGLQVDPEALARLSPEDREVVAQELMQLEESLKRNPLLLYNHPTLSRKIHRKQLEFHSPPFPPMRAFFGGNRSGKTTAGVVDRLLQQIDQEVVPDHLKGFKRWDPPVYGRVVTPDLTSTLDGVIHEKIREWCPRDQLKGGSFDRAFDKVQRKLTFKNGSWIQFNSSEQDREKLGGVALHWVLYDEEPRQEVRNECLTRLIDYDGEELFALTPFSGMKWLFDEVYEPWEMGRLKPEDGRVVVVDMDDNPHLSESGKKRALAQYSGPEREARKSGRFVSFQGLIYPTFADCVVPQVDRVPPGAEVFRGVDPGWRHVHACLYAYLDHEDELVIFDEIRLKGSTVKQMCDEMRLRDLRWGAEAPSGQRVPLRHAWTVIDPASKNKANQTGRSDQQEFYDNGVSTIPGQNAVSAGINRVQERLDAGKLKVTANCTGLFWEARKYRWVAESGRGENAPREAPVKRDDDGLDVLRYICMQRPLVPLEPVLPETMTQRQRLLRHHLRRFSSKKHEAGFGPGQFA